MKTRIAVLGALCLAALVSCSRQELPSSSIDNGKTALKTGPMSITVGKPDTKFSVVSGESGGLTYTWKEGDALSVVFSVTEGDLTTYYNEKFTLEKGAETTSATFTCDNSVLGDLSEDSEVKVGVFYPYKEGISSSSDDESGGDANDVFDENGRMPANIYSQTGSLGDVGDNMVMYVDGGATVSGGEFTGSYEMTPKFVIFKIAAGTKLLNKYQLTTDNTITSVNFDASTTDVDNDNNTLTYSYKLGSYFQYGADASFTYGYNITGKQSQYTVYKDSDIVSLSGNYSVTYTEEEGTFLAEDLYFCLIPKEGDVVQFFYINFATDDDCELLNEYVCTSDNDLYDSWIAENEDYVVSSPYFSFDFFENDEKYNQGVGATFEAGKIYTLPADLSGYLKYGLRHIHQE